MFIQGSCYEHISYAKITLERYNNNKKTGSAMFRKLVSNLAFSPALVGQLGFYAQRLKKEEATRRVGLIFTALALVVQSFAVFSPPEAANAASANDFIYNGVRSKEEFLSHYDANTNNIRDLFTIIGITRGNIEGSSQTQINSLNGWYSWGNHSYFGTSRGEYPYTIQTSSGAMRTYYMRPLNIWDGGANIQTGSTYTALVGTASNGMTFALMFNCGNLALKVVPPPPACPAGTVGTYPNCAPPPKMCEIPGKTNLPKDDPKCKPDPVAECKTLRIYPLIKDQYQFVAHSEAKNGATITGHTFTVKDKSGKVIHTKTIMANSQDATYVYTQKTPGDYTVTLTTHSSIGDRPIVPDCMNGFTVPPPKVCPLTPTLTIDDPGCQPCPGSPTVWVKDPKCESKIIKTKTAENTIQHKDARLTVAKASDKITYTVTVENIGAKTATYEFKEELKDVLEYATILDPGSGKLSGTVLSWPSVTLKPKEKQTRMFTVQLLATIPAMNKGQSDPGSYDCVMDNTFGNNVRINVECPVQKVIVEQTVSQLPHTGPGENMIFAGVVFAVVSYFYARSRQVKKEVRLIRRDLNAGTI